MVITMRMHVILTDVFKNLALLKKDDEYELPSCYGDNEDDKITVCNYLKNEFGLEVKPADLSLKVIEKNDYYYYCYTPFFKNEFKHNLDKITWIKENALKDVLTSVNSSYANKLTSVLTKILKSNFSFSKTERKDVIEKMKEAKEKGDTLAFNYYFDIGKSKLLNKDDEEKIKERYKQQLIKDQEEKERLEYLKRLNSTDLKDLTEKEAILIGKLDDWEKEIKKAFKIQYLIPTNPNGNNFYLFEAEMKLQEKNDVTPNILYELALKYKNQSYQDAKNDLQRLLNEKESKKALD